LLPFVSLMKVSRMFSASRKRTILFLIPPRYSILDSSSRIFDGLPTKLAWFFDCFANGSVTAFIHGSFARGLATPMSDVNIYIASYNRSDLDRLWSRSAWQGFPTVELGLKNLLGKSVTITCEHDPRYWVEQDHPMFLVWPLYEIQIPKKTCMGKLPFLENLIRQCWCAVSWQEICSRNEERRTAVGDNPNATPINSIVLPKRPREDESRDEIISAISQLDSIMESASVEDWKLIQPEVHSIFSLRDEIATLAQEIAGITVEEKYPVWNKLVERYQDCAAYILGLGNLVMPHAVKDADERGVVRFSKRRRLKQVSLIADHR
jgi:predicted nucleotidyltransferase